MAKVLIADDNVVDRSLCAKIVEKQGHRVVQASNGRRALETLADNRDVDLLITDVEMPEMDGLELVQRVGSDERFPNLPIIIVSGKVTVKEIASFLEEGATVFLPKPVKGPDLTHYLDYFVSEN